MQLLYTEMTLMPPFQNGDWLKCLKWLLSRLIIENNFVEYTEEVPRVTDLQLRATGKGYYRWDFTDLIFIQSIQLKYCINVYFWPTCSSVTHFFFIIIYWNYSAFYQCEVQWMETRQNGQPFRITGKFFRRRITMERKATSVVYKVSDIPS